MDGVWVMVCLNTPPSIKKFPNSSVGKEPSGFPGGSEVKASASKEGELGAIPGLGTSPGEGNGNPL